MNGWFESVEQEWQDAVLRWKSAVADFEQAYNLHLQNKSLAESLGEYDAWLDQLDSANRVRTAVEMLQESLAATSDWAKNTLGLGALSKMGAIPLIPVAVITGSIAAVVSVTYSLYSFNSEMQRRWQYIEANPGMTPQQVTNILDSTGPAGAAVAGIGNLAFWIVVGGLLLTFGPKLLEGMKR